MFYQAHYHRTIQLEVLDAFYVPRVMRYLRSTTHPAFWLLRHYAKRWIATRLSHAYQMAAAYLRAQQVLKRAVQASEGDIIGGGRGEAYNEALKKVLALHAPMKR